MKKIGLLLFIIGLVFLSACSVQKISDIKNEDSVSETVRVHGTVESTLKIGPISGYTLKDDTGIIAISSESLPAEGEEMTVSGILVKDTLFGYYIKVSE